MDIVRIKKMEFVNALATHGEYEDVPLEVAEESDHYRIVGHIGEKTAYRLELSGCLDKTRWTPLESDDLREEIISKERMWKEDPDDYDWRWEL